MKFTVSILCYKALSLARGCIRTVLDNSPPDTRLILTDNGSPHDVGVFFEEVAAQHPGRVTVIHNPTNEGFIEPNRRALAMTDTEFFILLNDDTQVPPGWLEAMEKPFREFPKAALAGLSGGCQMLTNDFHGRQGGNFEYLEGSCLMCKTEIVKREGLFSPYLEFAYGEDSDLSLRLRKLGYTLHKVNLMLRHQRAATSAHVPNIISIQAKNHAVLRKKWNHYLRIRKFDFPIVIRRWAARGDVVLVTAILEKLALENPLSPIYVETAFPEVFANNPHVKHAAHKIERNHETRVINLDMSYENKIRTHIVAGYAQAAEIQLEKYVTALYPGDIHKKYAESLLKKGDWCAIHPGPTTWPGKNWETDRWNDLIAHLRKELGFKVVLVGHPDLTPIINDRDLRGLTDTHQLAAVLARCRLFIGLDSFPLHVAQAMHTPTIGLFGCTLPEYIMTDGSPKAFVQSDPRIAESGARHFTPSQVSIPTTGEAMRSIKVEYVLSVASGLVENMAVPAK
jgi:ADP-heptose:LPS heptosyltransferase